MYITHKFVSIVISHRGEALSSYINPFSINLLDGFFYGLSGNKSNGRGYDYKCGTLGCMQTAARYKVKQWHTSS